MLLATALAADAAAVFGAGAVATVALATCKRVAGEQELELGSHGRFFAARAAAKIDARRAPPPPSGPMAGAAITPDIAAINANKLERNILWTPTSLDIKLLSCAPTLL